MQQWYYCYDFDFQKILGKWLEKDQHLFSTGNSSLADVYWSRTRGYGTQNLNKLDSVEQVAAEEI